MILTFSGKTSIGEIPITDVIEYIEHSLTELSASFEDLYVYLLIFQKFLTKGKNKISIITS